MANSLYERRLQGIRGIVIIVAKSRARFNEYYYHDTLQARLIQGTGHHLNRYRFCSRKVANVLQL